MCRTEAVWSVQLHSELVARFASYTRSKRLRPGDEYANRAEERGDDGRLSSWLCKPPVDRNGQPQVGLLEGVYQGDLGISFIECLSTSAASHIPLNAERVCPQ